MSGNVVLNLGAGAAYNDPPASKHVGLRMVYGLEALAALLILGSGLSVWRFWL